MTDAKQPDPVSVLADAKRIIRQFGGNALLDAFDVTPSDPAHRAYSMAVLAQVRELFAEGYEPPPMPEASLNERLEDGTVRLMAKTADARRRAEDAFEGQDVEDWVFSAGGDDEKIT